MNRQELISILFPPGSKKNVGENVVLDINVDPSLVVGAQIVWNGKYKNYSKSDTVYADIQRLLS